MSLIVLIRGGGDLASGVALRLYRVGIRLIITELPQPLAVRRLVSFSEAVYANEITVEGVTARLAPDMPIALSMVNDGVIPVLVDPENISLSDLQRVSGNPFSIVLVDARMTKKTLDYELSEVNFLIGLGPGFTAGVNCHAVIETKRGHFMGRVLWEGSPQADTGIPEGLYSIRSDRILRSPANGWLIPHVKIGDHLEQGQIIAEISGLPITAPIKGILRGLIHPYVNIWKGLKIGDIDPRDDPDYCTTISDKSLAVGGGVLEALLSQPVLRAQIWNNQIRNETHPSTSN